MMELTIKVPGLQELAQAVMMMAQASGQVTQQSAPITQSTQPAAPAVPVAAPQAPIQQAAPAQQMPVQQPAAPVPQPVPDQAQQVPTTAATYTLDDIAKAAMTLMDAGRQADLRGLLAKYGVDSLPALPPAQYGAFATDLRGMGAKI